MLFFKDIQRNWGIPKKYTIKLLYWILLKNSIILDAIFFYIYLLLY